MYRPSLRPGEELVLSSPGVIVRDITFDAFLTSKRVIFVKSNDNIQEKKELIFPLNLIKNFRPSSNDSGVPEIRFTIEKSSGETGDLVLRFVQTGEYRYAERDNWIENLKRLSQPRGGSGNGVPKAPPAAAAAAGGTFRDESSGSSTGQPVYSPGREVPPNYVPQPSYPGSSSMNAPETPKAGFCRFCGAKVPHGSAFCPSCGRNIGQQATPPPMGFPERPVQAPPTSGPAAGGFVPPPPPPPPQGNFGSDPGDFSHREDSFGQPRHDAYTYDEGSMIPPSAKRKAMMKEEAREEKARMKQQARAEKESRKAMKKSHKSGGNDPYGGGYRDTGSRGGVPKVLIAVIAVVAIAAVGGYILMHGMGDGTSTSPASSDSTSTAASTGSTTVQSGDTETAASYGNWFFKVFYAGAWTGTYSYNGETYSLSGFGYQESPSIVDPAGTISITITKADEEDNSNQIKLQLLNQNSVVEEEEMSSTDPDASVQIDYAV